MSRKRKIIDDISSLTKKIKHVDWNTMISASSCKNYMLDDPLLDWLKYYSITNLTDTPRQKNHNLFTNRINSLQLNHTQFIMNQGCLFENHVFNYMKNNLTKFNIVQVVEDTGINSVQSYEKYMDTVKLMKKGTDIIYQGVLHDYKNKLYGSPDLLIRSDKINNIFNLNNSFESIESKILGTKFHYVVVDIKHSTLQLNANQEYIKNTNSIPAYKGQILIYNKILKEVQGIQPNIGYILSKKILYTKNKIQYNSSNFMNNIACINYNEYDKDYINKVDNAINWITKMRVEGNNWKLLPRPSINELYPNMKNDKDSKYRKLKIELSNKINEITNVWWCSYDKRQIAHSKNIYDWVDPRLNANIMGFSNSKISNLIDNILNINRSTEIIQLNNLNNAHIENTNTLEFYLDFETINNDLGQFDIDITLNNIIFIVGLGWIENNKWKYKSFYLKQQTDECEYKMIMDMWDFIKIKKQKLNKTDIKFIHWSNAEINFYNKFLYKHPGKDIPNINSFDLHKLFLDNNIIVKGALNFSLKTVATAMYNNKMISTNWDKNGCSNGLQAMMAAYNLYKNKKNVTSKDLKDIIKYNKIDCKVLWEILLYLRINY
jgi:hypothetical protein